MTLARASVQRCMRLTRQFSSASTDNNNSKSDALYKRVRLELCAHDKAVLSSYTSVLQSAAKHLDIQQGPCTTSRKPSKERLTLLKSVHVYKKHRVQYEIRTHRASLELRHLTGSTADTYLEYVQRCLPEAISMKVTREAIEALPPHIAPPPTS